MMAREVTYYLEKLQSFPHRGVGTSEERAAAQLIYDEYERMGYTPKVYSFSALWNGLSTGYLMNAMYFLVSGILFLASSYIFSAAFLTVGIISMFFLTYKDNSIYKYIFPIKSQSIFSEKLTEGSKLNIVIMGHYDTAKRMIFLKYMNKIFDLFVSKQVKRGDKTIKTNLPSFFSSPTIFFNLLVVLQSLSLVLHVTGHDLDELIFIVCFLWIVGLIVAALQPMMSSYVPGANDNGIGAAMVLHLADTFKDTQHENVSLYFLNNSSEESIVKSAAGWAKSMNFDLQKTVFINLDGFAAGQLTITGQEVDDIGFKVTYDEIGFNFIQNIWRDNLEYYKKIKVLVAPVSTDANALIKAGYRVMVSMGSMSKAGSVAHYHQPTDTIDKIDWESVGLCEQFVTDVINKIDTDWRSLV